jgi:hypothetical protein
MRRLGLVLLVLAGACAHFDGFATFVGAGTLVIAAKTVHDLKHPSHPKCSVTHGPDTAVADGQRVFVAPQDGERWGDECLTWPQVRALRHS